MLSQILTQKSGKSQGGIALLKPLRYWLSTIEIRHIKLAQLLAKLPGTCPFARKFQLLGHTFSVPPLCHLNPFYNEIMELRWRAIVFLNQLDGKSKK